MRSETDEGFLRCSNFPERPSSHKLESDKPVLPEIEYLRGNIGEHKADIRSCNFVELEIDLEEGAAPTGKERGARHCTKWRGTEQK